MRIQHPFSASLTVFIMIVTASLAVTLSRTHIMILALDMAMIVGLRYLALYEGRKSL